VAGTGVSGLGTWGPGSRIWFDQGSDLSRGPHVISCRATYEARCDDSRVVAARPVDECCPWFLINRLAPKVPGSSCAECDDHGLKVQGEHRGLCADHARATHPVLIDRTSEHASDEYDLDQNISRYNQPLPPPATFTVDHPATATVSASFEVRCVVTPHGHRPRTRRNAHQRTMQGRICAPRPARGAPSTRVVSMAGYGVAFAVASLSCTIGPFLAVTGIALRGGCW
jgi:hypothetical protein